MALSIVINKIAHDLQLVVSFDRRASEASARLSKIILTHSDTSWAATLALVVRRQSNDERFFAPDRQQIFHSLRSVPMVRRSTCSSR